MTFDIGRKLNLSTKQILQRKLEDFENLTKDLFDNLSKAYTQRGAKNDSLDTISELVDQLITKDGHIKTSLDAALKQLERSKRLQKVNEEISKTDQDILQLQNQLKEAETILATALHQAKKKLETTQQAKQASVSCEELIKFAFRISSGNSVEAPPDWLPGDPRRPYPLDIEMRCGALGQLSLKGPQQTTLSSSSSDTTAATSTSVSSNNVNNREKQEHRSSMDIDEPTLSTQTDSSSRNGGIWQGPPKEDTAHLATMPVSAMMSNPTNGSTAATTEEVEFMSTSSDSSSSGDSS